MRKLYLILLLALPAFAASAKEVPASSARTVGYHFLSQKGLAPGSVDDMKLLYAAGGDRASYYVYGTDHSFVIVSGDDAVEPVLGYSGSNAFGIDKMPAQVSSFLNGYAEQIEYAVAAQVAATPEIEHKWSDLVQNVRPTAAKTTAVSPLMSTTWNQSPYYNANCPYDYAGGGTSVTGCVATATAQVMKYWNWPATGTGIHSYSSSCCGTLSANFGSTTYAWSSMPNNVTSPNAAVAKLMSHVGISVDMNYTASSSGAYVISSASPVTNCAEYALKTYFNYKPTLHGEKRSAYSETAWIALLKGDLDASHPIVFAGFGSGGGHCFVADGYDASNFFHINWGWGGTSDGYFSINALNPGGLGTGGGSGGYNSNQQAIIGIQPNSTAPSASLQLYDYVYTSASTIFYTDAFDVSTNVANPGTTAFSGTICAAAFNASGAFVSYVDSVTGVSIPAGWTTGTLTFNTTGLVAMLPGSYTIGIFYRSAGSGWTAVNNAGSYTNFEPMDVVNNNPMEMASNMTLTPTTFVQGSAASVNFNLQNDDISDFTGSYDVSLYNLDGTYNSTIQTMSGMSLASGYTYSSPYLTFSTSSVTAAPGTYLLAVMYNPASTWYLCGTDYFPNPIYVTVAAPAPAPDMYEVNNTAATAYNLSLTFTGDVATKSTTGSNFHVSTDNDYYKIVLASGYNYTITARVNDVVSSDDATPYTVDAVWSYSTDGGSAWSPVYTDVMPGNIILAGLTGGTVIFRVSPAFAGNTGKYLLKLGNITRTTGAVDIANVDLGMARVYPNPATDQVTADLSGTGAHAERVAVYDMMGKLVYTADAQGHDMVTIPVSGLAAGMYMVTVQTDAGTIRKQVFVSK